MYFEKERAFLLILAGIHFQRERKTERRRKKSENEYHICRNRNHPFSPF